MLAPPSSLGAAGNMLIGLRVTGDRVRVNAGLGARCESGSFRASATLGAGGAFAVSGVHRETLGGGRRLRTTYDGPGHDQRRDGLGHRAREQPRRDAGPRDAQLHERHRALGRAALDGRARRARRRRQGAPVWHDLPAPRGPAARDRHARLLRRHEAHARDLRRDAEMRRRDADGHLRLAAAQPQDRRRRQRVGRRALHDAQRDDDHAQHRHFAGRLGAAGAAGTFSATDRIYNRRTGRLAATCRSGTVRWTAAT